MTNGEKFPLPLPRRCSSSTTSWCSRTAGQSQAAKTQMNILLYQGTEDEAKKEASSATTSQKRTQGSRAWTSSLPVARSGAPVIPAHAKNARTRCPDRDYQRRHKGHMSASSVCPAAGQGAPASQVRIGQMAEDFNRNRGNKRSTRHAHDGRLHRGSENAISSQNSKVESPVQAAFPKAITLLGALLWVPQRGLPMVQTSQLDPNKHHA